MDSNHSRGPEAREGRRGKPPGRRFSGGGGL